MKRTIIMLLIGITSLTSITSCKKRRNCEMYKEKLEDSHIWLYMAQEKYKEYPTDNNLYKLEIHQQQQRTYKMMIDQNCRKNKRDYN